MKSVELELVNTKDKTLLGTSKLLSIFKKHYINLKLFGKSVSPEINDYYIRKIATNELIGCLRINNCLNYTAYQTEGHIIYKLIPAEQNKGYGETILKLGLELCSDLNKEEALVICDFMNESEVAVVVAACGELENTVLTKTGTRLGRFWIPIPSVKNKIKQK